jgi:hypothetical protein
VAADLFFFLMFGSIGRQQMAPAITLGSDVGPGSVAMQERCDAGRFAQAQTASAVWRDPRSDLASDFFFFMRSLQIWQRRALGLLGIAIKTAAFL